MSNTPTSPAATPAHDENQLMAERRDKLRLMREQQAGGKGVAFPNDIKPGHRAEALFAQYDGKSKEELEPLAVTV
ncbi:MAG: lysine--tRNA ligase, partial [Polaromonas sp.]|nr:lysine--tRNA ligase [Polaromonas sp.]